MSVPAACSLPVPLQVERLQRKFAMIHSTLAQQQSAKPEPDTPKLRASEENPLNMSLRSSLPGGLKVGRAEDIMPLSIATPRLLSATSWGLVLLEVFGLKSSPTMLVDSHCCCWVFSAG